MELEGFVRALRKRWAIVLSCLVLGGVGAAAVAWTATPRFTAKTELFVSTRDNPADLTGLYQGGQFTQGRVQSYAAIIDSPAVTQLVADRLQNGLSAKAIEKGLKASAPMNTVLINVSFTDTSARRAQTVVNAVSDDFSTFVDTLETPSGSRSSPVKVTVVKHAPFPTSPSSPRRKLDVALGLIIGLVVGLGGAVLRERADTSVRDAAELQEQFGLATLGAIAFDTDAKKRPLIVHADPHSSRAEAFRQLRTNLQFVDIDEPPRSIVITSSIPEEGKTTTASNLAIALAQSGMKVLLIEADLRRPRVVQYMGLEGAVGLTSVLIGKAQLFNAIQPWGPDNLLHVLPSGPTPPNPSELLGSQQMADLVRELELEYDLIVIDAPPLLPVTDAAVLTSIASGAVIVGRYGHAKREQLGRAVESLRSVGATIYGCVLTMTPVRGPDSYDYGYGYGTSKKSSVESVAPMVRVVQPHFAERHKSLSNGHSPEQRARRTNRIEQPNNDPLEFFLH